MNFINFTPHTIVLNDGRSFEPVGLARVSTSFSTVEEDICSQVFGQVVGLPEDEVEGTLLIVSSIVLSANAASENPRTDLVAPATGHPLCVRNDKGQITSVPCFVR